MTDPLPAKPHAETGAAGVPAVFRRAAHLVARVRKEPTEPIALEPVETTSGALVGDEHLPATSRQANRIILRERVRLRRRRRFALAFIALTTAATAIYAYLIAAPMYLSSAQFTIRSAQDGGTGGVLGKVRLSVNPLTTITDGFAVRDYLSAFDAMSALDKRAGFLKRMSAPQGDVFNRLPANASVESQLAFYNSTVKVHYNVTEGVIALDVYAFNPQDAFDFAEVLTDLANEFASKLNQRATEDALRVASADLKSAEERVSKNHDDLAQWRKNNASLDVEANAKMIHQNIGQLEGQLLEARNDLEQMRKNKLFNSPRRRIVEERIATLNDQIAQENDRLVDAKTKGSVVNQLGDYQRLNMERDFASKAYELASQSLMNAQSVASMQAKFVVKVSGPTRPNIAVWPAPWKLILIALTLSAVLSALGSLLATVIRDNSRA